MPYWLNFGNITFAVIYMLERDQGFGIFNIPLERMKQKSNKFSITENFTTAKIRDKIAFKDQNKELHQE